MTTPGSLLSRLESSRFKLGRGWSEKKIALLAELGGSRLRTASQVHRLHEHLCLLRAFPDDRAVLEKTEELLSTFARRPDLRYYKDELADTGIAGTDIHYRFFWPTARWLAHRWPDQLTIDWEDGDDPVPFVSALATLLPLAQTDWLRVVKPHPRKALAKLAPDSTDASFLIKATASMPGDDFTRESFYDTLSPMLILKSGPGTPARTEAVWPSLETRFLQRSPDASRPDLIAELKRPPRSIRSVPPKQGAAIIDLAREAMVTRGRDLDAFAYGDQGDVRLIEDEDGLAWAMIGMVPERRSVIRGTYGYLVFQNRIPTGYVQSDTLWRSVDLAFNTFETFRGVNTAHVLARTMAMMRSVFDARSFTLEPYQLGDGNEEGIASGAWWFYYRLGFRPRNGKVRSLVAKEKARMKRDPKHRSSPDTLRQLAKDYLFFEWLDERAPNWPRLAALGARGPVDSTAESLARLGGDLIGHASISERTAFTRLEPIVKQLPVAQWSEEERRDLVRVCLAKGGTRETDYLTLFNRHPRLGDAVLELMKTGRVDHR